MSDTGWKNITCSRCGSKELAVKARLRNGLFLVAAHCLKCYMKVPLTKKEFSRIMEKEKNNCV